LKTTAFAEEVPTSSPTRSATFRTYVGCRGMS
jgi:hypothetical protein